VLDCGPEGVPPVEEEGLLHHVFSVLEQSVVKNLNIQWELG